tara:strand:- start:301 stop:537 length:237 start_codon:yes stop_codon:yes gene_type:complete
VVPVNTTIVSGTLTRDAPANPNTKENSIMIEEIALIAALDMWRISTVAMAGYSCLVLAYYLCEWVNMYRTTTDLTKNE